MQDDVLVHAPTRRTFPKACLIDPTSYGYRLLAAVIDRRAPFAFAWESRRKRHLLNQLKKQAAVLRLSEDVRDVTVFKALMVPPGRGRFLRTRPDIATARYDIAVLVETTTPGQADVLNENPHWTAMRSELERATVEILDISASNVRALGKVDHQRHGVFLFNYFYADRLDQNLAVWEHTAGYFEKQTGLDNSIVLLPKPASNCQYTLINHCRWDRLSDILPTLIFRPSFRNYVLRQFEANQTAAMPVLYRLA